MGIYLKKDEGGKELLELTKRIGTVLTTSDDDTFYYLPYWFYQNDNGDVEMLSLRDMEKISTLIKEVDDLRNPR